MNIKHIESYNIEVYSEALKDTPVCKRSEVRELEANYEEAIEALCEYTIDLESSGRKYLGRWKDNIAIIEKATGKKWEELNGTTEIT